MTEREMDNLIDLFRKTPGPPAGPGAHGLYFILPKPYPEKFQFVLVPLVRRELSIRELTDLFLRGFVRTGTHRANTQAWIFDRLKKRALDPHCDLHPCFQVVSYPANKQIVERTADDIEDIPADEPIRIICRPEWFGRGYGRNPADDLYFDGGADHQGGFYGGPGGTRPLYPLRQGTTIPGACICRSCQARARHS